jgi:hypothetical protein
MSLNCFSQETDKRRDLDSIFKRVDQRKTDKNFADLILNSFTRYSRFLSFDVASNEYTGKVIIENKHLFAFLQNVKGFNKEQYQAFMKEALLNKSVLKLENLSSDFIKIKSVEKVESLAAKGDREFVKHYFSEFGALKDGLEDGEAAVVVAKLFEWKIIAVIDDETGLLVIY